MHPTKLGAVQLEPVPWHPPYLSNKVYPIPWTAKANADLLGLMNSVPEGEMRDNALKRIERLDCGNSDKTLASCDPAAEPPPEVLNWQKKLLEDNVDDAAFAKALATELRSLVCANDANALYVLRGISGTGISGPIGSRRLAATGGEAPAPVDYITSKDRPGSATVTDGDKAKLLQIKQGAEKKFAPSKASMDEKRIGNRPLPAPPRVSLLKDLCTLKPGKQFLLLPPLITLFVKISRAVATTHIAWREPFKALMAV